MILEKGQALFSTSIQLLNTICILHKTLIILKERNTEEGRGGREAE